MTRYFLLLILFLLPASTVLAQEADPADVESIDAIMNAYYDVISGPAGEAPDFERDKSLHHPDAWIAVAGKNGEGKPFVQRMTLEQYYGDNSPRPQPFYEYEVERSVQRFGNMVHVWSHYASAREPNGEPYTGGVNTVTLWHDGSRWWIMGWMFDISGE